MQAAIAFPNFINRNGRTELEKSALLETNTATLQVLGHEVSAEILNSGLHGIMITERGLEGGANPWREGVILGD